MARPFVTAITETRVRALPSVEPSAESVPAVLVPPLAQPSEEAVAAVPKPAPRQWWSLSKPAVPADQFAQDANRAYQFVNGMRSALTAIQGNLTRNDWIQSEAPEHVGQIYKHYDVAKASALATLANVKSRIDSALAAGAAAATSAVTTPTRQRYAQLAADVIAIEVERESLASTVEARHTEVLEAVAKAERAKQEAAKAALAVREDFKTLSGTERDSLVARMLKLTNQTGYGFASHPYNTNGNDYALLNHEAVIPTIVLNGTVFFGKHCGSYIPVAAARAINNRTELEDLVDSLMGKPQIDG